MTTDKEVIIKKENNHILIFLDTKMLQDELDLSVYR
jgi:hypothetical protein